MVNVIQQHQSKRVNKTLGPMRAKKSKNILKQLANFSQDLVLEESLKITAVTDKLNLCVLRMSKHHNKLVGINDRQSKRQKVGKNQTSKTSGPN